MQCHDPAWAWAWSAAGWGLGLALGFRRWYERGPLYTGPHLWRSCHVREKETAMKGLIGKKVGMTQVFDGDGNMVPVTIIDTNSCIVVGKRTLEKDKYTAVALGFGEA